MKICFINPTFIIRRPLSEIVDMLVKKGHKVSLMWPRPFFKDFDSSWHGTCLVKTGKVNLIPIPCFYFKRLRYPVPEPLTLIFRSLKAFREHEIIHIWAYFYPTVAIPLILKTFFSKKKIKAILTMDGLVGYLYKSPIKILNTLFRIYARTIGKIIFRSADVITFYSNILKPYAKQARMPMEKIVTIPTGVHLDKFSPKIKSKIRDEFGIPKTVPVISFVGMMTERKGVDIILRVARMLADKGYKFKVLLVGEGPYKADYELLSINLNLQNYVVFMGSRHDIPEIMVASDIYFMPSRGEGLSGSIMEAMASGLPIVATDDGLTRDLVIHGKNGFLGRPGDYKGYFTYLKRILDDGLMLNCMGDESLKIISDFDWNLVLKKYLSTYEMLR